MEIHLHEDKQMENCSVYGFIRKEGLMQGIFLGSFQISSDPVADVLETDAGNMGGAGVSLDQLCGMILETDTGAFMGTQWDDLPIRPDHFQKLEEKGQKEKKAEQVSLSREQTGQEETVQEEIIEQKQESEQPVNEQRQSEQPQNSETRLEQQSEQPQKAETGSGQEDEQQKIDSKTEVKGGELQAESIEEENGENPTLFPDCDQCWKIRPGDLRQICRKSNVYCNNRFLQHGYSHFGYILLCRRTDGKYILGVPGIYDQQERFMAEMFGFPWFKEWPLPGIKKGKSGYWYRVCIPCEMSLDGRP